MNAIIKQGLRKGWAGAWWMYKILIPISFATLLLDKSQVLTRLDGILTPLVGVLHLPAKAALPLVAGLLTGIYGGVAAISVLDFTMRETTLIAIFLLISHALPQEGIIQGKSGINPFRSVLYRLAASVVTVWMVGWFWSAPDTAATSMAAPIQAQTTATEILWQWLRETMVLCGQILAIVMAIMIASEWMRANHMSERLAHFLKPLLKLLGLDENAGLLWLTAALFGVSYGAAIIVEETRSGVLDQTQLERLHLSIGINHAMIEDPAVFLPLGVVPVWLWVPRLVAAIAAVHLLRLYRRFRPFSALSRSK